MAGKKSLPAEFGFLQAGSFAWSVMNTIIHSTLGLFASLLSALGFNRIANQIDLHVSGAEGPQAGINVASAIPCVDPCAIAFQDNA